MSPTAPPEKPRSDVKPPVEGQDVATADTGAGPVEATPSPSRSQTAKAVVTSAAKSMVYMHPVFLMGEVITGRKVGTSLKKSSADLVSSAKELAELLSVDAQDVIVVIDAQLKKGGGGAEDKRKQTYEVLQKEGEKALVVVSSSLDKARSVLERSAPEIKKSVTKNGRDVLVIVDKGLKNPLVITGVTKLAKSRGIPHAEAVIGLASLGMSKILARIPEQEGGAEEAGERIEEIDAEDFARQAPPEAEAEARRVAEESREGGNASGGSSCTIA